MAEDRSALPDTPASASEVDVFLRRVAHTPAPKPAGRRGRLLFALDATASRRPTWDAAARIQGDMFAATAALGGLAVQLAFYRGFGEFKVSRWLTDGAEMARLMAGVSCLAGETQIAKVLRHAINQSREGGVQALVFVGDSVEEDVDRLGAEAGELGLLGVPAFLFHEGGDPLAGFAFEQIARLTRGACCRFDSSSAAALRELLQAVAVFAAGGRPALEDLATRRGGEVRRLVHRMKG